MRQGSTVRWALATENPCWKAPCFRERVKVRERRRESCRRGEPSAWMTLPPVGLTGLGRRRNLALCQHAHPARFVAGAGILWHTSAHKGSPLFHRWAPVPITANPEGSPDGSCERGLRRQETFRELPMLMKVIVGSTRNCLLADDSNRRARTPSQKVRRAGAPCKVRGFQCHQAFRGRGRCPRREEVRVLLRR